MLFQPVLPCDANTLELVHWFQSQRYLASHALLLAATSHLAAHYLSGLPSGPCFLLSFCGAASLLCLAWHRIHLRCRVTDTALWLAWVGLSTVLVALVTPLLHIFFRRLLQHATLWTGLYLMVHAHMAHLFYRHTWCLHPMLLQAWWAITLTGLLIVPTAPDLQPTHLCSSLLALLWTAWALYDTHYHRHAHHAPAALALLSCTDLCVSILAVPFLN